MKLLSYNHKFVVKSFILLLLLAFSACSSGRYSSVQDSSTGVVIGAGAGAITGAQLSAASGPGAAVGAGFGAIAGGVSGLLRQSMNQDLAEISERIETEKQIAEVHSMILEHYERRIAYHPTRDIYPADYFFEADSNKLSDNGKALLKELARLNKKRFPWSRLVVAVYNKSQDKDAYYGKTLAVDRAREIGNYFVRYGIEPRRIETRPMLVKDAILVIPEGDPRRFSQAIELIAVDK